jgi:hypothetical protein
MEGEASLAQMRTGRLSVLFRTNFELQKHNTGRKSARTRGCIQSLTSENAMSYEDQRAKEHCSYSFLSYILETLCIIYLGFGVITVVIKYI